MEEVWGENKGDRMTWGYDAKIAHQYQTKSSIQTGIDTHCHALITGSSGSGKSVAVSYLLGRRLQADPDTRVFVCDYKNSEDFRFLHGYANYYTGEKCYDGIMAFYQKFNETRESGGAERERYLLIFDEYPAFLNRLQMLDKQNKEKRATDVMNAVSEILMLGRGLHYGIWIVTQRQMPPCLQMAAGTTSCASLRWEDSAKSRKICCSAARSCRNGVISRERA